jgi:hypothetical protein
MLQHPEVHVDGDRRLEHHLARSRENIEQEGRYRFLRTSANSAHTRCGSDSQPGRSAIWDSRYLGIDAAGQDDVTLGPTPR